MLYSAGIGLETAKAFAARGARLVLWDIDVEGLAKAKEAIEQLSATPVLTQVVDMSDRQAIYDAAKHVQVRACCVLLVHTLRS